MTKVSPELEPEMEQLLARVVPNFASKVKGASSKEIEELERIAGRPLPSYYRWFLSRMGRSMGPFAYNKMDFSAKTVLACYKNGTFKPDPRFFMIAHGTDPLDTVPLAYDLDHPARDDARVHLFDGTLDNLGAETLRELHADRILDMPVKTRPQRMSGILYYEEPEKKSSYYQPKKTIAKRLVPVMTQLGFTSPVPTGANRALYEREDAVLTGFTSLDKEDSTTLAISISARDEDEVRRLLTSVTGATGTKLDYPDWDPPL